MTQRAQMEPVLQETVAKPSAGDTPAPRPVENGQVPSRSIWEKLFEDASPAERQQWLETARREGVVYAHRLASLDGRAGERPLSLAKLLTGPCDHIEPPPLSDQACLSRVFDSDLDETQQEVVRRALQSPDLFLIQGLPGTGKSRLVAELVRQLAAAGQRMLLVSPSSRAIDRVLEQVGGCPQVLALRCLSPGEDSAQLPPLVQALTFAEHSRQLTQEPAARAQRELESRQKHLQDLEHARNTVLGLQTTGSQWQDLERQQQELAARLQAIPIQVREEVQRQAPDRAAQGFLQTVAAEDQRHGAALGEIRRQLDQAGQKVQGQDREHQRWQRRVRAQERLLEAKKHGRFYTLSWWRSLFQSQDRAEKRLTEFQCRAQEACQAQEAARAGLEELGAKRDVEEQHHVEARDRLMEVEVGRRREEIELHLAEIRRQENEAREAWLRGRLGATGVTPVPLLSLAELPSTAAVTQAVELIDRSKIALREQIEFARQWSASLAELAPVLPDRMLGHVNVLAAPLSALEQPLVSHDFDVLIVDQADRLSEAELLRATERARRWVLVGQPPVTGLPAVDRPFQRLWQLLHCEPRQLPYRWQQDGQTLVCQLRAVTPEQRGWIEIERLADRPEVELRILALPQARPLLAEVVFPARSFTIQQAKAYLYQQLEELTLRPAAGCMRWQQQGRRLCLEFGGAAVIADQVSVPLEEGVCEVIASAGPVTNGSVAAPLRWETRRLEFDMDRGWDRTRAEQWLKERAGLRDLGRTGALETQWRATAELGTFVSELLQDGTLYAASFGCEPSVSKAGPATVQFICVPGDSGKAKNGPKVAAARSSGSLELDLADPRQRQRLPVEARGKLPMRGTVNLAEARTVVSTLAKLLQHLEPASERPGTAGGSPTVAVLSPHLAQVQLIETLWKLEKPAALAVDVAFEAFAGLREAQADVVVVSLCHSNGPRVVAYAQDPGDWRTCLMAARRHLILAGDVAALSRRRQYAGPLGHQDEATAAWERALITRLLEQIQNPRRPSRLQVVRQGNS